VTRVAAVDCGTNTIRLLVADLDPRTGGIEELEREMRIVRLGQDVDRTGRLADAALARTFAAIEEYAALIGRHSVEVLRFCATSAARGADNADAFAQGVQDRLGVTPDVVTGDEEAQLSYDGATRSLVASDVPVPILVVDIGGGSTELILGDGHGHVRAARSLDVGSVRLTERLLPSDPPTADEVAAATAVVDRALDELPGHGVRLEDAATVVGVAGTITTLGALALGLEDYDRAAVHHSAMGVEQVHRLTRTLLGLRYREREALHIDPGRADVIGAGALLIDRVLRRTGVDAVVVSENDILDGIAWSRA
jgi:exopolyphosphatase / guanosine-5'-triphosphate,3'-diphosphate pyrophosphatase